MSNYVTIKSTNYSDVLQISTMKKIRTVTKNSQWKNVALSVQQPWASLICSGIKDIENRRWQTDYRGRLYIVASSKNAASRLEKGEFPAIWRTEIKKLQERGLFPDFSELHQSAVIGYVDIVDCTGEEVDSIWSMGTLQEGNINWILRNAHTFEHTLFPGFEAKLNLFEIPELDEDNLPPTKS